MNRNDFNNIKSVYNFGLLSISSRNYLSSLETYIIHIIILFFGSPRSSSLRTPEFFIFNRTDKYEGITRVYIYKVSQVSFINLYLPYSFYNLVYHSFELFFSLSPSRPFLTSKKKPIVIIIVLKHSSVLFFFVLNIRTRVLAFFPRLCLVCWLCVLSN
jgi:hypothetical protein